MEGNRKGTPLIDRLEALERSLATNECNLRQLLDPDIGPLTTHFSAYQATTIRCVINSTLTVSGQVREMAGLLRASMERPHSG